MSFSDAAETSVLALIFNATAWANLADNAVSAPMANIPTALHTADPGDAGTQATSEVTYTGYARTNVARTTGGFTVSGNNPTQVNPVSTIIFPAGTGGSGTVTNFSFGKTGGAIIMSGAVAPNIIVGNGITPELGPTTTCTLD